MMKERWRLSGIDFLQHNHSLRIEEANTIKGGKDLQQRWGSDILGLTNESIEELIEFLIPQIREYLVSKILQ